ncbi:unnamed protein product, partial [Staurois parvus]
WGPRAIGDHGAPVSLPKLKKAYEKGGKPEYLKETHAGTRSTCTLRTGSVMVGIQTNNPSTRGGLTTHGAPGQ